MPPVVLKSLLAGLSDLAKITKKKELIGLKKNTIIGSSSELLELLRKRSSNRIWLMSDGTKVNIFLQRIKFVMNYGLMNASIVKFSTTVIHLFCRELPVWHLGKRFVFSEGNFIIQKHVTPTSEKVGDL